mgnify:CR=1 FL=1
MRVKLYSVIMLAVVTFTACSNDEMSETQTQKGLTLSASVENLSTRASMKDESGTWKFAFENNDKVSVINSKITENYTFQKTGEQFTCANATPTNEAADWYAYFPGNDVDLTGQDGTLNGVANYLAAAGKTTKATTGKDGLAITLHAQVAVLRIVEADKKGALDIQVKTAKDKWVTGLSAQKNETSFNVVTSDTKTTLLSKAKAEAGDFNYVVVPAGVGIQVYNGDVLISQTTSGLTAGKYYTITSVPTKGQSYATINSKDVLVGWVQLWPGGPRFATESVAEEMTWNEAKKTGTEFVWGENWRTPNAEEVTEKVKESKEGILFGGFAYDWNKETAAEGSPSVKVEQKDVNHVEDDIVTFTGVYPGYTKTQLTLYNQIGTDGHSYFDFWTTSESSGYGCKFGITIAENTIIAFGIDQRQTKDKPKLVRPILAK